MSVKFTCIENERLRICRKLSQTASDAELGSTSIIALCFYFTQPCLHSPESLLFSHSSHTLFRFFQKLLPKSAFPLPLYIYRDHYQFLYKEPSPSLVPSPNDEGKISDMVPFSFMYSSHIKLRIAQKFQFKAERSKLLREQHANTETFS